MERKYTKTERKLLGLLKIRGMTALEIAAALDVHRTYVLKLTKGLELKDIITYEIDYETRRNVYSLKNKE
jgi:DNA-binding MarR family transcriptional regulator